MSDFYVLIKVNTDTPEHLKQAVTEMLNVSGNGFNAELITTGWLEKTQWQNWWPKLDRSGFEPGSVECLTRSQAENYMVKGDQLVRIDTIHSPIKIKE